jgi:hypothetical protein
VMLMLPDIRGLNVMRKTHLRSAQQWADPPLATAAHEIRANLNPKAVNPGLLDANGRLRIQPIITAQNPGIMKEIIEAERGVVREGLYMNLFQILVENPGMSATEAMLRANEKGELLGPNGAKIQTGLAHMIEREISIYNRKGAFDRGEALEAPESLNGRRIGARMTSPLDRLRRMQEMIGTQRVLELVGSIAQMNPQLANQIGAKFDWDFIVDLGQDVFGAPKRIMLSDEQVADQRQKQNQQSRIPQLLEMAKGAGEAGKSVAGAVDAGNQLAREQIVNGPDIDPAMIQQAVAGAQQMGVDPATLAQNLGQ